MQVRYAGTTGIRLVWPEGAESWQPGQVREVAAGLVPRYEATGLFETPRPEPEGEGDAPEPQAEDVRLSETED